VYSVAMTSDQKPAGKTDAAKGKRGGKTRGSWKPGQSGNPRGRVPDKELVEARALAEKLIGPYAEDIVRRLVEIAVESKNEQASIKAATELLNRLWGRPAQSVEVSGKQGAPLITVAEVRFVSADGKDLKK
jgi:hypothetical protein